MAGRLRPPSDDSRPHRRASDLRIPDDGAPLREERDLHQQQATRAGEQSDDADRFGDNSDLDELRQLIRSRVANRAQKPAVTRSHPADDAGAAAPEKSPEDTPSHVDSDGRRPDRD